jgi:hypothetical protein
MQPDETILGDYGLSAEQQRLILETLASILASPHFKRSKRYPALLEYAVRNTLAGNTDVLKERIVGMEVFDRQADYDPTTDSVVRMAASEVRKRLALYYSVNPNAPVRIDLPIGSYTPEFCFQKELDAEKIETYPGGGNQNNDPNRESRPPLVDPRMTRRRWVVPIAAAGAALVTLIVWRMMLLNSAQPVEKFWAPLEKSQATVLISLGESSRKMPPAWEAELPDNAMALYMQRMTNGPVPDITAANLISQHLANHGGKSEIRMATSTQFSDLRMVPAVLLGAGQASPWTMRLGSNLRYQFGVSDGGAVHLIVDKSNPTSHDWRVDLRLPYDQVVADYALVTRQLNPSTGQWWVGIGGSTTLSTPETVHALLDPSAMKALEAQLPRGWEKKNLQFVIQFTLLNGNCGGMHVVATNVW